MFGTIIGAVLGSAIDGADGDDPTVDGAIEGAIAATAIRLIAPLVSTCATGWLVLHGIGRARDAIFGEEKTA